MHFYTSAPPYKFIVTCQEYSKAVNQSSTEIKQYENVSYLFSNSKRSAVHIKKEIMWQEILQRDYGTITQDNLITIMLFSLFCGIKLGL